LKEYGVTFGVFFDYIYLMSLKYQLSFILVFLIGIGSGLSQNIGSINFSKIRAEIEDPASEYYYPALLRRIWADDTTLTVKHYKRLYYGSVFQDTYHPYGASDSKKAFTEIYSNRKYKDAIIKGKEVLLENPVDIEVTLKMIYSYLELKDTASAKIYGHKYFNFLDVIYASGDGQTAQTAFVVISVDDEYRIVGDLGLNVRAQMLIDDCDLLMFEKRSQRKVRKKKIKQLYFNVQMPLMSLSGTFKDADLPDPDPDEEEDEPQD
jgi:hypothetical protein